VKLYDTAEFRSYAGLDDGAKTAEVVRRPAPKNPDQAGGRNNYFASMAGKMRRAGFTAEAILAAIKQDNAEKGYDLPERELVTIAGSIGSYDAGDSADGGAAAVLDGNVIQGLINHGIRIDAAGRLREIATGAIAARLTVPRLTNLIWSDLRQIKKVPAEDIGRLLDVEIYRAQRREFDRIAAKVVGRPETPEALEELRRFVRAVGGTDDKAVVGGFLQFLWCVKRSLAGLEREHDIMPVLYNQIQGNGKSTAVRRLVSPLEELVDSITAETLADDRKRPDLGRFVVGVWDEMEGADRKDTEAIKNAISCQDVSYRPMKTNDNVSIRRLMNFIGTSNKPLAAMMRDSSGNRRFLEVETPAQLDQEAINEIDYDLLWQAVSEKSRAPAKQVIGEIRTHQAGGRFQDTISLWLESQDFSAYTDGRVPVDEMRALYTTWCDRSKDSPVPTFVFNHRLAGEGFRKVRTVTAGGARLTVFTPPASTPAATLKQVEHNKMEATKTRQHSSREIQEVMTKSHTATRKVMFGGKADFPEAENALAPRLPGWPKPPRPGLELWVYDCEVFPDRFMLSAFDGKTWAEFDETSLDALAAWLRDKGKVLAGFNSHGYDDILAGAIVSEPAMRNPAAIYALSCRIIDPKTEAEKDQNFKARYKNRPWAYSIDVFQLLNGKGALKEWECRIGFPTVAESPAAFDRPLPAELVPPVRQYCRNDVLAAAKILTDRWPLVLLRETLAKQFDLGARAYCLSEQGLAQATFLTLHRYRTGEKSGEVRAKANKAPENQADELPLAEIISERVAFKTEPFQAMLARLKGGVLLKDGAWRILLDWKPLEEPFPLADCDLSVMVGGLHTVDSPGKFVADAETAIVDLDVTSYYPSLMLAEKVYPSQLGESFLEDFKTVIDQRIAAKRAGDKATADALKIVANATFGKLNDSWSPIRSVRNAFRVTMNGQMFLLMLIEALHSQGFKILSANTDGLMILAPRARLADLAGVTGPWERQTGLTLERTDYARVCRRDVNAYVALAEDGKVKTKGPFNSESGKGDGRIIREAAIAYLLHGTDPAKTVADCADPVAFLFYQRAKNGGELYQGERLIGKTARWYAAGDEAVAIKRRNPDGTFDTIPNAHQAALALDIAGWTVPSMVGLDRGHYVSAAWELIRETGT
jgi:hypothetical protein